MEVHIFFFLSRDRLHTNYIDYDFRTSCNFVFSCCEEIFCIKRIPLDYWNFQFLLSVSYMTEQLPRLHNRIQFALSTTAGIILQSSDYTKEFQTISDIQSPSNASISRYLYYLKNSEVFSEVMPEQLYYHLFKTLKDTRGFVGFFRCKILLFYSFY